MRATSYRRNTIYGRMKILFSFIDYILIKKYGNSHVFKAHYVMSGVVYYETAVQELLSTDCEISLVEAVLSSVSVISIHRLMY